MSQQNEHVTGSDTCITSQRFAKSQPAVWRIAGQFAFCVIGLILAGIVLMVLTEVRLIRGVSGPVQFASLAAGLTLGTIAGAFILCAVAGTHNQFRAEARVPELQLKKAMLAIFSAGVLTMGSCALVLLAIELLHDQMLRRDPNLNMVRAEETLPWIYRCLPILYVLVLSCLLWRWLPTKFGRALLISICYTFFWIIIGLIVCGVWLAIGGDFREF